MFRQQSERVAGWRPRGWAVATLAGLTVLAVLLYGVARPSQAGSFLSDVVKTGQDHAPPAVPPPAAPPQARPPNIGAMPGMMGRGFPFGANNRLGVQLQQPSATLIDQLDLPKNEGLILSFVPKDSAAHKAGFEDHDILLKLNGKAVPNTPWQFDTNVRDIKSDQKIDAVVLRKGKKKTLKDITLPEAPRGMMAGMPGMIMRKGMPGMPGMAPMTRPPMGMMPPMMSGTSTMMATATNSNGVMTTLFKSNDHFTARHQEGNLIITVTGKAPGAKGDVTDITVQDGPNSNSYRHLDKVPERYRDKVKNLIDISAGNNGKIEVKESLNRTEKK